MNAYIGELVQYILNKGFFMSFTCDGSIHYGSSSYRFRAWKVYDGHICQCSWIASDFSVSPSIVKDVLFMEADRYLKQVNDAIDQCRLIDSALK